MILNPFLQLPAIFFFGGIRNRCKEERIQFDFSPCSCPILNYNYKENRRYILIFCVCKKKT